MKRWLYLAVLLCLTATFVYAEEPFALLVNSSVLVPLEQVATFCGATLKQEPEGKMNIYLDGKLRGGFSAQHPQIAPMEFQFTLNGVYFADLGTISRCLRTQITWNPVTRVATVRHPVTKQEFTLPLAGAICTAKEEIFPAVQANDLQAVTRILQQHPEQSMALCRAGSRPLNWAVRLASPEMVMLLLKAGADPNITKKTSSTPLLDAIELKSLSMAELLLKNHADPNVGELGNKPLTWAIFGANYEMVALLLSYGANVNCNDAINRPSLLYACSSDHLDIIKLLLDKGANPNLAEKPTGYTSIHVAAFAKNIAVAELLLTHGADPNIKGQDGQTALMIATLKQDQPMIELLKKHGGKM